MQSQSAKDVIEVLAAKLSVPAEHLWGVLVRQGRVEAMAEWVWTVAWIVAAIVVALVARHWLNRVKAIYDKYDADYADYTKRRHQPESRYDSPPHEPDLEQFTYGVRIARFVFLVICFGSAIADALNGARYFANPEFYALTRILDALK